MTCKSNSHSKWTFNKDSYLLYLLIVLLSCSHSMCYEIRTFLHNLRFNKCKIVYLKNFNLTSNRCFMTWDLSVHLHKELGCKRAALQVNRWPPYMAVQLACFVWGRCYLIQVWLCSGAYNWCGESRAAATFTSTC